MKPLGIPDGAWNISYGESYNMDGLKLQAIGSGGRYTTRAIARLGQFMLNKGNYFENQLATPDLVESITTYTGTPIYRGSDAPEPAPGLGWWVNFDGFWPSLPRDAFLGAGAGHQILLVIPSLELVVVKTGQKFGQDKFGGDFWTELEIHLFEPLMEAVIQ